MVPEGGVLDRVLSSQRDAAEQDEEEDQVGEDGVVDDAVALEAEPVWQGGKEMTGMVRHGLSLRSPSSGSFKYSSGARLLSPSNYIPQEPVPWGLVIYLRSQSPRSL